MFDSQKRNFNIKWMDNIQQLIQDIPDMRDIYWMWEIEKDSRRWEFIEKLMDDYNALIIVVNEGMNAMDEIVDYQKRNNKWPTIVILEMINMEITNDHYAMITSIKDGFIHSDGFCRYTMNRPHLFVFASIPPDIDNSVSRDRWNIISIK
jgi:hypothetical protein